MHSSPTAPKQEQLVSKLKFLNFKVHYSKTNQAYVCYHKDLMLEIYPGLIIAWKGKIPQKILDYNLEAIIEYMDK